MAAARGGGPVRRVAGHRPHAGQRRAPRRGNFRAAFRAFTQPLAARQLLARAVDRVFDAGVDLVLHRAVAGESSGHASGPPHERPPPGGFRPEGGGGGSIGGAMGGRGRTGGPGR